MVFLPFLASMIEGWLLVGFIGPARGMRPRWAAIAVETLLGAGAGIGLASFLYFFLLLAGVASPASVLLVHLLLLAVLTVVYLRARKTRPADPGHSSYRWNWLIVLIILGCLVPVLMAVIESTID